MSGGFVATARSVCEIEIEVGELDSREGIERAAGLYREHGCLREEWSWQDALPIEGKAGDAIFFHYQTIHGSQENHSDKARPVFINRYRRFDDFVVLDASSVAGRQEAESRRVMKKSGQKGLMLRGFRPYDPEA